MAQVPQLVTELGPRFRSDGCEALSPLFCFVASIEKLPVSRGRGMLSLVKGSQPQVSTKTWVSLAGLQLPVL